MSWERRLLRRLLIASASIVIVLLVCGVVYERVGEHRDRMRYSRIGRAVDIGSRRLNIYCSGTGGPAVILESAGHTAGYSWINIQPEIAKFTRACWYDRAGYGWSDPGPSPRTFSAIAKDLHALLHNAGVGPPYVLVGATAGAFHVRVFTGLYPDEVAGVVLIHGSDPDVFAHEPPFMKGALDSWPSWLKSTGCHVLLPTMVHTGVLRLLGNPGAGRPFGIDQLDAAQKNELRFLSNNPQTAQTEGEGCTLDESMNQVRAAGNLGSRPLRVLVSARPFRAPGPQFAQATEGLNEYWFHDLQPRLAALSTRGQLLVNDKAESPESIVAAVKDVVDEVRGSSCALQILQPQPSRR